MKQADSVMTVVRESKEQTRKRNEEAIITAAEMAFAEHGYRGASISMIAGMAGVPKSNVTYYFGSKDQLYEAVLSTICLLWLEAGDEIHAENDPFEALESYIHHKMDLARSRPHGSKVWANEVIQGASFIGGFLETTVKAWVSQRSDVMQNWMDRGLIRRADPEIIFYMIWATTQHYADFNSQIEAINGRVPLSEEQWSRAKETVSSTILRGLMVDP